MLFVLQTPSQNRRLQNLNRQEGIHNYLQFNKIFREMTNLKGEFGNLS